MKKRSCEILQSLINKERPPYIKEFAQFFNVTERTIRSDINDINLLLVQLNIPPLRTVDEGLIILDSDVDYTPVRNKIRKMGYYFYKMSPTERHFIIILILANKKSYMTMSELSEALFVSRQTIMSDISEIKDILKPYGISINSQTKKGVKLQYSEKNIRLLLIDILGRYLVNMKSRSAFGSMTFQEVENSFTLDEVYKWLHEYEISTGLNFSDEGFQNLLLYIFVTVNRFPEGYMIEKVESSKINRFDLNLAQGLFKNLAYEFDLIIELDEVNYLTKYIKQKKIYPLSNNINMYPEINVIVANFLFSVFQTLGLNLSGGNRNKLFEFLVFHIKAMAERLNSNRAVKNPFKEQIMTEYVDVNNAVIENLYLLEEYLGSDIENDEIAFITMHIRAALERQDVLKPSLNIVVACPGSIATGQLIAAQLRKYFNINIKKIIAKDRIVDGLDFESKDIDFIVSSVALPECSIPTVVVNPILKEEDVYNIQALAFNVYNHNQDKKRKNNRRPIIQGFSNGDFPVGAVNTRSDIQRPPFLHELIQPSLIESRNKSDDWREAIRVAGNILVEYGYASPNYIDLMITNVEEYGPYCVISKGLALAHAESKGTVSHSGMSLLILKDGVNFNHKSNDPVFLVFCFCVNDDRDYLQALTNLIAMSKQNDFLEDLLTANNKEKAYRAIKQKELIISRLQEVVN